MRCYAGRDGKTCMVIEWLKVKVAPELREKYIQLDAEVWTAAIAQAPATWAKKSGSTPMTKPKSS